MRDETTEATREETRVKVFITVREAMSVLKHEMINDNPSEKGSLAHSWHDNIAMACFDAMKEAELNRNHESDSLDHHAIANDAASSFMKMCFDVDTSKGA